MAETCSIGKCSTRRAGCFQLWLAADARVTRAVQLLRLAGWREGRGLGAAEQGIASPLPAWHNRGRSGIGAPQCAPADARAPSSAARAAVEPSQGQQQRGPGQEGAAAAVKGAVRGPGRPRRAPKRGWETVAVEEALPIKVARVKQVRTQDASSMVLRHCLFQAQPGLAALRWCTSQCAAPEPASSGMSVKWFGA